MVELVHTKMTMVALGAVAIALSFALFKNRQKEILLSLLSCCLMALMAEVFFRQFYRQISEHESMFEYDEDLGWRFIADKKGYIFYFGEVDHYVETNSSGFRDYPPPPNDAEIEKILVIGDSFVSNLGVKPDEVFTEIIEGELKNTAVLNYGVNGYGQVQEYLLVKKVINQINPDLALLVIYVRNDFDDNLGGNWFYPRPVAHWDQGQTTLSIKPPPPNVPPETSAYDRFKLFYRKSHFFTFLNRRLTFFFDTYIQPKGATHKRSLHTPPELYLCRLESSDDAKLLYRTMEVMLLRIAQVFASKDIPLLFVIAPSFLQVDNDLWRDTLSMFGESEREYDQSLPNNRLARFFQDHNLRFIDLLPKLAAARENGGKLYNPKEMHWTSEGNRIVANVLLENELVSKATLSH